MSLVSCARWVCVVRFRFMYAIANADRLGLGGQHVRLDDWDGEDGSSTTQDWPAADLE